MSLEEGVSDVKFGQMDDGCLFSLLDYNFVWHFVKLIPLVFRCGKSNYLQVPGVDCG